MVSATQIALFKQCPRLWVERYLFGNKQEPTQAMNEGLEAHQAIEAYLKTGKTPEGKWQIMVNKVIETLKELDLV